MSTAGTPASASAPDGGGAPVSRREAKRAEGLTWLGCALVGALLAAVIVVALRVVADASAEEVPFFMVWLGCSMALLGWAAYSGRVLMAAHPGAVDFRRQRDLYRGSVLILPGITVVIVGAMGTQLWRPGGLVVAAIGGLMMLAGFVVGTFSKPRWLLPVPIRDDGWPTDDDADPPTLHPAFIAHVLWLRRLHATLFGDDPAGPLARRERPSWLDRRGGTP